MALLVMMFITAIQTLRKDFISVCDYICVHDCIHVEARIEVQYLPRSLSALCFQAGFLFLNLELIN